MSENSSDSDSSCGWTVINHEGSDTEMMNSEHGVASDSCELTPECSSLSQEELQVLQLEQGESSQNGTVLMGGATYPALEEMKSALEGEEEKLPDDNLYFGTVSDDSDIVTLEPPKLEETGSQEEAIIVKEAQSPEDFNMGSSSSSQYTFCQPETERWWEKLWKIPECIRGWDDQLKHHVPSQLAFQVFSSQPSDDESSSDETSHQPSPAFRRRRARKKTVSSSESEERLLAEQETEPSKEPCKRQFNSGLNKCVILALVIAISMGFGHFYGTIQIQKRQQLVRKIHKDELNDMKDYLSQCQQEQGSFIDYKSLKENLARCWTHTEAEKTSFETQKRNLDTENQYLRISLEKEEKALSSLQEELRKLREQIRILEDKGTSAELVTENQKLKQHLEEEKLKTQSFLNQKETLLAEAKMLRRELEREQLITMALRVELQQLSSSQSYSNPDSPSVVTEKKEIEVLRERLTELERKLNFEQQRSDLWERLYVEAKDQNGKQETDGKKKGNRGNHRAKNKSKETFLGSVKETFDAMKNSTKEFVRHHKEKIKQAKEAVKENLKKFSDSVKSTFRHFKDTTKNIFDEKGNKRFGATKEAAAKKPTTVFSEYLYPQYKARTQNQNSRGPTTQRERRKEKPHFEEFGKNTNSQKCSAEHDCGGNYNSFRKACSGVFECAQQESINLFNVKMLNPVRIDEFRQLIERYLLEKLDSFHHWKELDHFINNFFLNGIFIHDQKLFTDFVNDVKDYLKDMKEYQVDNDGVFEKLDGYIYRHFFGHTFSPPYGPSRPDKKQRMVNIESSRHRKQEQKHPQPQPYKREGKWHKYARTNGRHMANLEIELGQLPFDPKY
ncbi:cell cycle progression protein 1 isoform X1 [Sagmatias obliquidens]|uniref:cell cycle progression protein 1 isoform X1 n=1 Tax=Sagmatias obliquidens TaxID=3371155 RepID=UPI000F441A19|nr:cell cycle progression protein 1 isoform X1 [Lagenorhynchus obliquidens]XP_026978875.1 cell cycle progression protein 1 isoform X1 [Lagenorhynchus obliquidens]XP_026978876.1 cell cycle progression protein 1 isoform X1 [Lagenorhynchus obliquidens]